MTLIPPDDFEPLAPSDDDGTPAYLAPYLDRPPEEAPAEIIGRRYREIVADNIATAELLNMVMDFAEATLDRLRAGRPDQAMHTLRVIEEARAEMQKQRPARRPA